MSTRVSSLVVLSVLGWLFAASPATAAESRVQDFSLICDGTERTVGFAATDLGASVNRFIQGAEVTITAGSHLQYLRLQAAGTPNKTLLTMGTNEVSARNQFTGFLQVMTDAAGTVSVEIIAACKLKRGAMLHGTAVVYFFS